MCEVSFDRPSDVLRPLPGVRADEVLPGVQVTDLRARDRRELRQEATVAAKPLYVLQ